VSLANKPQLIIVQENFTGAIPAEIRKDFYMLKVAVIDQNKNVLAPTSGARARILLKKGKAAVFRRFPFTISAPHHAVCVSPIQWGRTRRKFLGQSVYLEPKGERDSSILIKATDTQRR
jgi:hypothetical protein